MSIVVFPDRVERTKASILARWRREFAMAGMKAPEAQMQQALDVLLPGVCEHLATDAAIKRLQKAAEDLHSEPSGLQTSA